eukprot:NODE_275_length_2336_cov_7.656756_g216_i0.p12 GENE.NODE_275_length_2336_cov_7.656756_g216_i0~~NODE_275_length_2336_cov_7.656756_g216_i0.p12  ORF type:complete len:77 (+),score=12.45 NODE_275_length_2336_cov_7.656756_g216_i0:377-607(+)
MKIPPSQSHSLINERPAAPKNKLKIFVEDKPPGAIQQPRRLHNIIPEPLAINEEGVRSPWTFLLDDGLRDPASQQL